MVVVEEEMAVVCVCVVVCGGERGRVRNTWEMVQE